MCLPANLHSTEASQSDIAWKQVRHAVKNEVVLRQIVGQTNPELKAAFSELLFQGAGRQTQPFSYCCAVAAW